MTLRDLLIPRIRPGEAARFWPAVVSMALVGAVGMMGRAGGQALFLDSYPASYLAYLYIGTAVLSMAGFALFGRVLRGRRIEDVLVVAGLLLAVSALALRLGLTQPAGAFRIAAYLFGSFVARAFPAFVWMFVTLTFDPREGKRLFAFIGGGGTVGAVVAGFAIPGLSGVLGTEGLFLVMTVLGAALALLLHRYGRTRPAAPRPASRSSVSPGSPWSYYRGLLRDPLVRNMSLLVAVSVVSLSFLDFLFMQAARTAYSGPELAAFFGRFFGAASLVALGIQFLLAGPLLRRWGVLLTLSVLPVGIVIGCAGAAATGLPAWFLFAKFLDPVFQFTLHATSLQILFLGVPTSRRPQARTLVDGFSNPAAFILAGIVLIVIGPRVPPVALAALIGVLCLVWLWLNRRSAHAYLTGILETLGARRLDVQTESEFPDRLFADQFRKVLRRASDEEVEYLLPSLESWGGAEWTRDYRSLLDRRSPRIQCAALGHLQEHGDERDISAVTARLHAEPPEIRAAAAHALGSLEPGASAVLLPLLEDPEPTVQAAAAVELTNRGDGSTRIQGQRRLQALLAGDDPLVRLPAVRALGHLRRQDITELIAPVLQGEEREVRRVALRVGRNRLSPDLVPVISDMLADPQLSGAATETLVGFGNRAIDYLAPLATASPQRVDPAVRARIPLILAAIGTPETIPLLRTLLQSPDPGQRYLAARSLGQVLRELPGSTEAMGEMDRTAHREGALAVARHGTARKMARRPGGEIAVWALEDEYRLHLQSCLLLLGVRRPDIDMEILFRQLTSGSKERMAQAAEVLEGLLGKGLREELVPILEGETAPPSGNGDFPVELLDPGESTWVLAGAVHAAGKEGGTEHRSRIEPLLEHAEATVRETALHALRPSGPRDSVGPVPHTSYPHPEESPAPMLTVEKVLFLRKVSLFCDLEVSELGRLAGRTREVVVPAGTGIFQAGDEGDSMYVIVEGRVRVHLEESELATLSAPAFFGQMSLLDAEPRSASVSALDDCLLLRITRADFQDLVANHPNVALDLLRSLSLDLRRTNQALAGSE